MKSIVAIIVLLAFFVSTTGFTYFNHVCNQHSSEVNLAVTNCCGDEPKETQTESSGCCESKTTSTDCNVNNEIAACCDIDVHYYRLNEEFVNPQIDTKEVSISITEIDCFGFVPGNNILDEEISTRVDLSKKKPKQPIYRLYHQVKIEPPLI